MTRTRRCISAMLTGTGIALLWASAGVAQEGAATSAPIAAGSVKAADGATSADPLLQGFRDPPHDARPQAWWHWMNGNVTEAGIKADLEWMHRVGIGGVQRFDAGGAMASYSFIKPRLIVAMGRFAAQSLLNTDSSIGALRGKLHDYNGVPVIVTYHPAYLLRNLDDKAKAWEDLCYARRTMRDLQSQSANLST